MRFRQIHLDFHTSEAIPGIGSRFDKSQFQNMLKAGHVDSITVFSKCHHGWAYHPSEANEMHPHLHFDLLGAMIEAAHEIDVKTPVYLSAGLDEKLARRHPEWLIRDANDNTNWVDGFMKPGYHQFCLNSPYLDVLIPQIEEVVRNYDADGIFLDIVGVRLCYCHTCVNELRSAGEDPRDPAAVLALGERTYANYTRRVREAIDAIKPGLPVFHNGGHIRRGRRDLAGMNSHLELESLPTGGWGYDHFPLSARYAQGLGMPFLGMTGKFHTTWGEFGGYKHPNALRYETALSLANGARCSVGDQLHPEGYMDEATYRLIGLAYREVEAKEAWCRDAKNVADVALLSVEAAVSGKAENRVDRTGTSDAGAVRMLLEGKVLFDVVDLEGDFAPYKVLILPDQIAVSDGLAAKLEAYAAQGGKLLVTGHSGLNEDGTAFAVDLGIRYTGESPYKPEYFRPAFELPSLSSAAFVFYSQGCLVEASGARILGSREFPYFNRDVFTFSSHQHTPNRPENAGPGMTEHPNGIYIAWNVFEDYAVKGSLALKESVLYALNRLLGDRRTLQTNLAAQGIVTLAKQQAENRYVQHLLYASPVKRGSGVEVIEDLLPVLDTEVQLVVPEHITRAYLAPQGTELPFTRQDGLVTYTVPRFECHQMVVLEFD
ncbi:beta-galactosidase trimerization domain-containing protein [Paenibacillus filicis]|uniref:Beta-galactosidase trimerization domain-containing protein n=1 Tax=Paenibacillus gyeongsangnamensis TaxID=3388067 RepID=A0ABT4Q9F9_9BACL|nr:beta-galactosidase trimerization domain-containing protein [Paenibacillus filicis]MCZ8513500.1 beta-galactosidase trimerization domain-containing protein [Paenibacillus filicis]